MAAVHTTAVKGFAAAGHYENVRPDYPAAAIDKIIQHCGLTSMTPMIGSAIADVGAGTGKFTRMLDARGLKVTAVEPVKEMREQLSKILPNVAAVDAPAQHLPFADGSLDVLCAAQAFHWFATRQTLNEFARVLRPGGHLVLIWNRKDEGPKSVPWARDIEELLTKYQDDAPRYRDGKWRSAFVDTELLFGPMTTFTFSNPFPTTAEGVVQRALSNSFIAKRSDIDKAAVRTAILDILRGHGIPTAESPCSIPYETDLCITQRLR